MADDPAFAANLSGRLVEAHRRVAEIADDTARSALSRRLIAITNVAKHDLVTAARRLDSLLAELDAGGETTET